MPARRQAVQDPLKNPMDQEIAIARVALPVLLDRLGGTAIVGVAEMESLGKRFGGVIAISVRGAGPGMYRLAIKAAKKAAPTDLPIV